MALKSEPYYWVVCDRCGTRCDYGDYSAMSDEQTALDGAENVDWLLVGEWPNYTGHFCDGCIVLGDDGWEPMPVRVSAGPVSRYECPHGPGCMCGRGERVPVSPDLGSSATLENGVAKIHDDHS